MHSLHCWQSWRCWCQFENSPRLSFVVGGILNYGSHRSITMCMCKLNFNVKLQSTSHIEKMSFYIMIQQWNVSESGGYLHRPGGYLILSTIWKNTSIHVYVSCGLPTKVLFEIEEQKKPDSVKINIDCMFYCGCRKSYLYKSLPSMLHWKSTMSYKPLTNRLKTKSQ